MESPAPTDADALDGSGETTFVALLRYLGGSAAGRAAALLGLAALAVRGWVAWKGYFYWDDLVLTGRGASYPLLSSQLLLYDHDGHFMPGAFLLAGELTRAAPLQWLWPVVSLVVLQGVAALAVLRVLWLLLGQRWALLVPWALYLFAPLTLTSFLWWAAALNALPLQAALAWFCGDALLLHRTGRRRYAISGLVVLVLALSFFEKSVVVPFVAFALVLLVLHVDGDGENLAARARSVLRRCRVLWVGSLVVLLVWVALYTSTVGNRVQAPKGSTSTLELLRAGVVDGLLPTLVGGPWAWQRLGVSSPFAQPPHLVVLLGAVLAAATFAISMLRRRNVALVWCAMVAYVLFDLVLMLAGRSGTLMTPLLVLSLRYLADSSVVIAMGVGLLLRAPGRPLRRALPDVGVVRRGLPRPAVVGLASVLTASFVASSLWSTATLSTVWSDGPTRAYLAHARASFAGTDRSPFLEQPVPADIFWPLGYPNNLASQVLGPLPGALFSSSTTELRVVDDSGVVRPAHVDVKRTVAAGLVPECGYQIAPASETALSLGGPLFVWGWTVQLNYLSAAAGSVVIWLDSGAQVTAPVVKGPGLLFVRVTGGGGSLHLRTSAAVANMCLGNAAVGLVAQGAG